MSTHRSSAPRPFSIARTAVRPLLAVALLGSTAAAQGLDCGFDVCLYGDASGTISNPEARLDYYGFPTLGDTGNYTIREAQANSAAAVLISLASNDVLVPGVGQLYVSLPEIATLNGNTNRLGNANFALSIPSDPNLIGLNLYQQGFVIGDGVELTNGLQFTIADNYGWPLSAFSAPATTPWTRNRSSVDWVVGSNTFQWDTDSGDFTMSGPVPQSGNVQITSDPYDRTSITTATLNEGSNSISFVSTVEPLDSAMRNFRMETVVNGSLQMGVSINIETGATYDFVSRDKDAIAALEAQFDWTAFEALTVASDQYRSEFSMNPYSLINDVTKNGGPNLNAAGGWSIWKLLATCAASSVESACCASAVVNGVGALCCVPAALLLVTYTECIADR